MSSLVLLTVATTRAGGQPIMIEQAIGSVRDHQGAEILDRVRRIIDAESPIVMRGAVEAMQEMERLEQKRKDLTKELEVTARRQGIEEVVTVVGPLVQAVTALVAKGRQPALRAALDRYNASIGEKR